MADLELPSVTGDGRTNVNAGAMIVANIGLAGRLTDPDSDLDPTTVSITSAASNGVAVSNGDGTVTYTPHDGFVGTYTFMYEICDSEGLCDQAQVTVEVTSGAAVGPPSDPGEVVPDGPSNADEGANPHACEDNPGRADEHRPDNTPPCRGD